MLTGPLLVDTISFRPGAANDELIIREGGSTGNIVVDLVSAAETTINISLYGAKMTPYIDFTNGTLSADSVVIFYLR